MTKYRVMAGVALLLRVSGDLSAQNPLIHRLTDRVAVAEHGFTTIAGIRELRDGRLVVSDTRDNAVRLLSANMRIQRQIGRFGAGPGEYRNPAGLHALAGDSTLLHDPGNQRFVMIDHSGAIGRTFPMPAAGDGGSVGFARLDVAATGRLCSQPIGTMLPSASGDSAQVLCGTLVGGPFRKVTALRKARQKATPGPGGGLNVASTAFDPEDAWLLAADGALGVVRSSPYRVEWHPPVGSTVVGPAVPWQPLPVTAADREALLERRREALRAAAANLPSIRGSDGTLLDPAALAAAVPPPMADSKPSFWSSGLIAGPDRELWVRRHRPHGELPLYDLFDARGHRTRQVELSDPDSRVVAVTTRYVYVVREDEDGLHHLERWRRPTME